MAATSLADSGSGLRVRKTRWHVSNNSPKTVDELPFFGRDERGHAKWWDVTLPKTDYWHAHQMLGRAYAFDLLDLLNNPEGEFPEHILSFIVGAQIRWQGNDPCGGAVVHGFHEVLSEYLETGTANR